MDNVFFILIGGIMSNLLLSPVEIAEFTIATGEAKTKKSLRTVLISSFFSGSFITFGALASLAATYALFAGNDLGIATYGLGKFFQGFLFAAGLMFVIFLGSDLFTGNCLIVMAWLHKKVTMPKMLSNLCLVWLGNFVGAIVVGFFVYQSGIFNWSDGLMGGVLLKTVYAKSSLSFSTALFSGVVCNWLVCLIILATYATKDLSAKMLIIILGIMIFVASGSEHIVANMGYYAGAFFARGEVDMIAMSGKSAADIAHAFDLKTVLVNNFIPVTIGNIIGGTTFVGALYYYMVKEKLGK